MSATIAANFWIPHQVIRFSGVTTLSNVIISRRLVAIYRALLRDDIYTVDRILKDTIRIFRTAPVNFLDKSMYSYLLSHLLHLGVELRLGKVHDALGRMQVMNVAVTLPEALI